jgi:hypothetical protein
MSWQRSGIGKGTNFHFSGGWQNVLQKNYTKNIMICFFLLSDVPAVILGWMDRGQGQAPTQAEVEA